VIISQRVHIEHLLNSIKLFIIALDISSNYFNVKYMKDKVKEFREKHPWLDAIAGFIPYVGEAQDMHDFAHAAKK